jgi:hypothetical protein
MNKKSRMPNFSEEEWRLRKLAAVYNIPPINLTNKEIKKMKVTIDNIQDKLTKEILKKIIIVDDNGQERIATLVSVNDTEIIIK